MAEVRKGEVTMKGNPVDLAGPRLKAGDKAPDFECVSDGLSLVKLGDTGSKVRLFSVVPSLDTPVCNVQTRKFAEQLNALGDKVEAYTISLDLPFAMKRFCSESNISNLKNLSDTHNHSFGEHYGVLITSLPMPLLARSIFVVDTNGTLKHVEYVPEIAQEPNYDAALGALREAAGPESSAVATSPHPYSSAEHHGRLSTSTLSARAEPSTRSTSQAMGRPPVPMDWPT